MELDTTERLNHEEDDQHEDQRLTEVRPPERLSLSGRQSGRGLFGSLINGLPSGGDVLSCACSGMAGAQERHCGGKREDCKTDNEFSVHRSSPFCVSRFPSTDASCGGKVRFHNRERYYEMMFS